MATDLSSEPTGHVGRSYRGASAAERVADRRQRLLDAALSLFGTIGYRATTVRGLCRAAGLSERYFYESFPGTEALLIAVYRRYTDALLGQLVGIAEADEAWIHDDPALEGVVVAGLEAFFASVEDDRVLRVCWLEVLGVSPEVDAVWAQGTDRFAQFVAALLTSRAPECPEPMARLVATALVGGLINTAIRGLLGGPGAAREDLVRANAVVFAGTLRQLSPARAAGSATASPPRPQRG